jgi:hypothetical protein
MLSNRVLNNFSGFKLNDEKNIEPFKAEDVSGEEVCSEERVPMSGEELLPRKIWFDVTGFTEMRKDTADGFVGKSDIKLCKFVTNSSAAPEGIIDFHLFDE